FRPMTITSGNQPVVDLWTCKPAVLVEVQTERAHAWQPAGDRSACK
ncbi:4942_t:CDS:2, partial [Racocetra persica]